jgi:hypothetical protein
MAYLLLEILACVFAVVTLAALAFILCATFLLVREALTRATRVLQKTGARISQLEASRKLA